MSLTHGQQQHLFLKPFEGISCALPHRTLSRSAADRMALSAASTRASSDTAWTWRGTHGCEKAHFGGQRYVTTHRTGGQKPTDPRLQQHGVDLGYIWARGRLALAMRRDIQHWKVTAVSSRAVCLLVAGAAPPRHCVLGQEYHYQAHPHTPQGEDRLNSGAVTHPLQGELFEFVNSCAQYLLPVTMTHAWCHTVAHLLERELVASGPSIVQIVYAGSGQGRWCHGTHLLEGKLVACGQQAALRLGQLVLWGGGG